MIWLALHLPLFPLETFSRSRPELQENACALIEKQRIYCCNSYAKQQGIKSGQALATAITLYPELKLLQRNHEFEEKQWQQLAYWAYRFSPMISLGHKALLLEVGSCLKLFDNLINLKSLITQGLDDLGFSYQMACAKTPKAASLMAQAGIDTDIDKQHSQNALWHKIDLNFLPITNRKKTTLRRMGLTTLDQLLQLPSASLGKRLGPELHSYLLQLTGEQVDPQKAISPPSFFDNRLLFDSPIGNHEMLAFPMQRLLSELNLFLSQRQWQTQALYWQLFDSEKQQFKIKVLLGQAQSDKKVLLDLTRLQFEKHNLRHGILSLRLYVRHFNQIHAQSLSLFDEAPKKSSENLSVILDKLRARLGRQSLSRLHSADEHLPEAANVLYPSDSPSLYSDTIEKAPRPCWLLTQPLHVRERSGVLFHQGALQILQGPERIETLWWQQAIRRDYFIAQQDSGSLFWLFKDLNDNRWFIHGIFS